MFRRLWRAYRELRSRYAAAGRAWAEERAGLLARVEQAEEVVRKLKVQVGQHTRNRFGRRSEQQQPSVAREEQNGGKRGQRPGKKGHGRRRARYAGLPEVHVTHDVPEEDKYCHNCGTARVELKEDTSEELHVEIVVSRRVHHRKCYVATCACPETKRIVRAEPPVKLIPRGSLSVGAIAFVATARYMWGLPLHRITTILRQCGAQVPDGTLVGIFKASQPLLQSLYDAICGRNRRSKYLHADETTWRQLWVAKGKRGYIWCFVGTDTTVYLFDPGRGHAVVLKYLGLEGTDWGGHVVDLMCDFMAAYDKAMRIANADERRLTLTRCWSHYRRLFLDIPAHHPEDRRLAAEVDLWLGMIAALFRLHHERDVAADGSEEQELAQAAFQGCLLEMEEVRTRHLRRRKLAPELRHVLEFGAQHWEELTRCAEDPHHPMHNNVDERQHRLVVISRKNAYGSGAQWAAEQACQFWTVGQTALQNEGNPLALFTAYFEACAQAEGKVPEDWARFLPWVWEPQPPGDGGRGTTEPTTTEPAPEGMSEPPPEAAPRFPAPAASEASISKGEVVVAPPDEQSELPVGVVPTEDHQAPAVPVTDPEAAPVQTASLPSSTGEPDGPLVALAGGCVDAPPLGFQLSRPADQEPKDGMAASAAARAPGGLSVSPSVPSRGLAPPSRLAQGRPATTPHGRRERGNAFCRSP